MSLLSSHKSSDSGLQVHLHPLVLLTISDYITRHTLRKQPNPIVGALLGQQSGRSIILEQAFECALVPSHDGEFLLDDAWFGARLQQYKDVHTVPALELVGWFTTAPVTGPEAAQLPIHQQILQKYNETAILLAFHPSIALEGGAEGGKLPLTIYESVYESPGDGGDTSMDIDGQEKDATLELRFKELPYSVETGEAEMIGVDFVARGGGNATALDGTTTTVTKGHASQSGGGQTESKAAARSKDANNLDDAPLFSAEDEELIASLMARANAVKMLHTKIQLLKEYLTSLPPSYLTAPSGEAPPASEPKAEASSPRQRSEINYTLLRSILALLSRLPLLLPAGNLSTFHKETVAEQSDVELVSLLGALGRSMKDARELGRKFNVVDGARRVGKKERPFGSVMGQGGGDGLLDAEDAMDNRGEGGLWQ